MASFTHHGTLDSSGFSRILHAALFCLSLAALIAGIAVLTLPIWSGLLYGFSQRQAARLFTIEQTEIHQGKAVTGDVLGELSIPMIGVEAFVVQGLTFAPEPAGKLLKQGPAHLVTSALPGGDGNMVILGHLNVWGSVFLRLHDLRPGNEIRIRTPTGAVYTYQVTGQTTILETDVAAIAPHGGPPTLQLVTCGGGWLDRTRVVVNAKLVSQSD